MSTHEADTFEAVLRDDHRDEGGGGAAPRRRRALAAGAIAGVLVVAGVVAALVLRGDRTPATEPAQLVPALARAQSPEDEVDADDLDGLDIRPATTRFLLRTSAGSHFVAVDGAGRLCVVTVRRGDLPARECAPARPGTWIPVNDSLRLVTAGGPRPPAANGWRPAGDLLWTR